MNRFLPYLSIIMTLLLACDVSEPDSGSTIIPLNIGNEWDYRMIEYNYNAEDSSFDYLDTSFIKMKVLRIDTLDTFIGYVIDNYIFYLGGDVFEILFANKNDGFYQSSKFRYGIIRVQKALSYPTFIGDLVSFDYFSIKTTAVNETINIFSQSFDCIVYEFFSNQTLIGKLWVKPGIGIIKRIKISGNFYQEYVLINYDLIKPRANILLNQFAFLHKLF